MTKTEEAPRTTPADGTQAAAVLADGATLHVSGAWTLGNPHPDATEFLAENPMQGEWTLECGGLKRWDTTLLVFLSKVYAEAETRGFTLKEGDLPRGLSRLLQMCRASRNATSAAANAAPPRKTLLQCLGSFGVELKETILEILLFTGELTVSIGRLLGWRTQMRWCDFRHQLTECGPKALPIISLISFLMGLVLAFVGSIPLKWFQAQQYVASLVGIGMFRLMAPVMVGIVMAGRTSAAYAAELGTMQANDELDALETLGILKTDFLVLPRFLAMALMLPLLNLFADFVSTIGGLIVATFNLGLTPQAYWHTLLTTTRTSDLLVGVATCFVLGVLDACCGCYQGIHCGRSAADVGRATTSSVVYSIVCIVIATSLITVITVLLEI